jgi:hypothetical protein
MMAPPPSSRPQAPGFLPRLAPPPRHVPLGLRARLTFGGLGVFAWIWLAFGSGMATVFLREADLTSWFAFRGDLVRVEGQALGCEATHASEGGSKGRRGTPIYANRYTFEAGGSAHEGVSYATGSCLEAGTPVEVEHLPARPELSRIAGMRRSTFGPAVALVAIFPLLGLALVALSLRLGRRQVRLLERGRLALGTLVGKEETSTTVNKRRVMKLRFAIEGGAGTRHEVEVRTHRPEVLEDEPKERILFDPEDPASATAWDLLPGPPALDAMGQLEPPGALGTLLVLLPPAAAVAVLVLLFALG